MTGDREFQDLWWQSPPSHVGPSFLARAGEGIFISMQDSGDSCVEAREDIWEGEKEWN